MLHGSRYGEIYISIIRAFVGSRRLIIFVLFILDSTLSLPSCLLRHLYLSIWTAGQLVDVYCLKEFWLCLRWDIICVPCHDGIVHSHQVFCRKCIHLHIKTFLLSAVHVVFDMVKLHCFIFLGWYNLWLVLELTEGIVQVINGNMDIWGEV